MPGWYDAVERLGHDAVETGALEAVEPVVGDRPIGGRRREVHDVVPGDRSDERRTPRGHRLVEERAVVEREQVERDERSRRLGGQPVDPRLGRVDALQQRVEVEPVTARVGDDDLAVDDAALGQRVAERIEELGEVAAERTQLAGDQLQLVAVAEHDAAEAVPLRLEQPAVAVGDRPCQLRQHRLDRRLDRQVHVGQSGRSSESGRQPVTCEA